MKAISLITLTLVIVGGISWLLVGLFQFDHVAATFGGHDSGRARIVYILIGLSALWQVVPLARASSTGATIVERKR